MTRRYGEGVHLVQILEGGKNRAGRTLTAGPWDWRNQIGPISI